jgi:hypothetical protein
MMRTNWRRENEVLVGILNRRTGSPEQGWVTNDKGERVSNPGHYYIGYAYGQPRLERMASDCGAAATISPRVKARELHHWLLGYLTAVDNLIS